MTTPSSGLILVPERMMSMRCRPAAPADAPRLVEIYAPYVAHTAITFATVPLTAEDFLHKMNGPYPFLVCEENGLVLGYAYAAPYRAKEAYRWDVELSIYVDAGAHRRGVGRRLMGCLLALLRIQGYRNAYSGVTLPNEKSIGLHRAFGFKEIGLLENTGYKLGKWHSVAWLRLPLGDFDGAPAEPLPLSQLSEKQIMHILDC